MPLPRTQFSALVSQSRGRKNPKRPYAHLLRPLFGHVAGHLAQGALPQLWRTPLARQQRSVLRRAISSLVV